MDRQDCAYLINSTPKYYFLLPIHLALLKRYAPACNWPIYIASEVPDHPILKTCDATVLPLEQKDRFFIESRAAAIAALPSHIKYVFLMQDDFLLDRAPMYQQLQEALELMDTDPNLATVRLMPCPGPMASASIYRGQSSWRSVMGGQFVITYQATVWRREIAYEFFSELAALPLPVMKGTEDQIKKHVQITLNCAENGTGQALFTKLFSTKTHIGWVRKHTAPNAVYLSPWPYRPTAVERGILQDWAKELIQREGFTLDRELVLHQHANLQ